MSTPRKPSTPKTVLTDTPAPRTVNGRPVADNPMAHLIPSGLTDQAIEAENAKPGKVKRVSRVVRDAKFEQKLARMEREVEHGTDPFMEVIDDQRRGDDDTEPNSSDKFRFISDRVTRKRGMRGWEPVLDEKGDRIQVAGLTLAAMPREIADLRDEKYRRMGADQFAAKQEELVESQERLIREAHAVGLSPLRSKDVLSAHDRPDVHASIGINHQRGGDS